MLIAQKDDLLRNFVEFISVFSVYIHCACVPNYFYYRKAEQVTIQIRTLILYSGARNSKYEWIGLSTNENPAIWHGAESAEIQTLTIEFSNIFSHIILFCYFVHTC